MSIDRHLEIVGTMGDAASWVGVPSSLLLAEIKRRQQEDGEKPACGGRKTGRYDTLAHVFALFLILTLSTLGMSTA